MFNGNRRSLNDIYDRIDRQYANETNLSKYIVDKKNNFNQRNSNQDDIARSMSEDATNQRKDSEFGSVVHLMQKLNKRKNDFVSQDNQVNLILERLKLGLDPQQVYDDYFNQKAFVLQQNERKQMSFELQKKIYNFTSLARK